MKIAALCLGALVLLVLAVVCIGWLLPVAHEATVEEAFPESPDRLWAVLADVQSWASWRSVRELDGKGEDIRYETSLSPADRTLVRRIVTQGLPFGGQWTIIVQSTGTGSLVKVTEAGQVYQPVFRFVARFVFGHSATMQRFLKDLHRKLGAV